MSDIEDLSSFNTCGEPKPPKTEGVPAWVLVFGAVAFTLVTLAFILSEGRKPHTPRSGTPASQPAAK